jgi:hypothetical protein
VWLYKLIGRDVDVLINNGETIAIKNLLGTHTRLSLDNRTRRLTYTADSGIEIDIDVLTAQFALMPFGPLFPIYLTSAGTKLASPAKLLGHKIQSSYTRSSLDKKLSDMSDVRYLVKRHVENGVQLPLGTCPSATPTALKDLRTRGYVISDEEWQFMGGHTT